MQRRSNKAAEFDFDAFLRCKHVLRAKDELITAFLVQSIFTIVPPGNSMLRLLDVGSGEGSVVERTCLNLGAFLQNGSSGVMYIEADCVEPSPEGIRFVKALSGGITSHRVSIHPHCCTVEEFLKSTDRLYDAILCIHFLYHVNKDRWPILLRRLSQTLKPNGVLFVNLVSRKSEIYDLWKAIQKNAVPSEMPRLFHCYGHEYYAEQLERELPALDGLWVQRKISSKLHFSRSALQAARRQLNGAEANSELLHFLAFMFRVPTNALVEFGRDPLLRRLKGTSTGITFETIDKMFVFTRNGGAI